jgi:hypothetical protein
MIQMNSGPQKSDRARKNVRQTMSARKARPAVRAKGQVSKAGGSNSVRQMRNVFEAILKYGHDEDFAPATDDEFFATEAPAGSREKLDVMAERVLRGEPLWHPEDRPDYSGLTAAVRPRE